MAPNEWPMRNRRSADVLLQKGRRILHEIKDAVVRVPAGRLAVTAMIHGDDTVRSDQRRQHALVIVPVPRDAMQKDNRQIGIACERDIQCRVTRREPLFAKLDLGKRHRIIHLEWRVEDSDSLVNLPTLPPHRVCSRS